MSPPPKGKHKNVVSSDINNNQPICISIGSTAAAPGRICTSSMQDEPGCSMQSDDFMHSKSARVSCGFHASVDSTRGPNGLFCPSTSNFGTKEAYPRKATKPDKTRKKKTSGTRVGVGMYMYVCVLSGRLDSGRVNSFMHG